MPAISHYEWANDLPPAAAPPWLIEEIAKCGGAAPSATRPGGGQYDYWARIAGGVREGERHIAILKLAGLLIRKHPATLAFTLLRSFNQVQCHPPLPDDAVDERFSRVVKREMAKIEGRQ